ncbi:MAG: hypothetical protein WDO14_08105 [Bacteroidota bacterium]
MVRVVFGALLLVVCCSANVFGQAASSPFSAFGIGEYNGSATAPQQGMGGVGVSNPQYLFINTLNPALLVFNGGAKDFQGGLTGFQAGILGEKRTISDNSNKDKAMGGNLNYLAICFPIKKTKWVTAITSMPYSTINYKFSYTQPVPDQPDTLHFLEKGTGGINQVAWSNGVAITRKISVGAKASYLYSTIENSFTNTVALGQQTLLFQPDVHQRYYYKGFQFQGGISVHLDSLFDKNNKNKNYVMNFGATYDFQSDLKTDYLQTLIRTDASGTAVTTDTLVTNSSGKTSIPSIMQAGISFGRISTATTWMFAIDGRMTDYTKFGYLPTQETPTTKGWRLASGFEITPNLAGFGGYLKAITYRVGASMEKYPYLVNGTALKDLGTNFGLSFPLRGCSIDLAGRVGRRGTIDANTITEKYFKIYFGVTFNDRWFVKRKFD